MRHTAQRSYSSSLWWRNLALVGALFVCGAILLSCLRIVWRAWEVEKLLKQENMQLDQLKRQRQEVEQDIQVATSSYELERRAREELLLQASEEAVWRRE